MKRILALVCVLAVVLSLGILPASAASGDVMELKSVYLRTQEGKEGIYFRASFLLTQDTVSNTARYGLALTPYEMADDAAWTAAMDSKVQRSKYTSGLVANKTTSVTSTSLINILNISNDNLTNNNNANTVIYVRPYVELSDGSFIYGEAGSITMKQVTQMVDEIYSTLDDTQRKYLLGMYERFVNVMKGWGLTNLKADYAAGGYNAAGESLLLQYRREKVVANMQAQAEILWSFTGEAFQYSRAPSSIGIDNDTQSNVYTMYPGRVYKGIPYTHGAAGLDIYYAMGEKNASGVYVIDGLNGSYLTGGTSNGIYNASRMGNDCWDAISWAYEAIGSSVSANQTNQVTPDFGMYPVGPYAENLFSLFLTEPASDGKVRLTTFDDIYTNNFSNNAENRQLIYESYAVMQPGDTMVHFVSGAGGHALMAVSVNVVRNSDGTINPDQSTVTFIEQGSGHEKAQSIDFDVANLTTQSLAHSGGHNSQGIIQIPGDPATCKQCATEAGYDAATDIWTLNPGQVSGTFTELFDDGGYYIPMTCKELSDPTFKPASTRISDSVTNTTNVANIFTGKISSTYRISQITLDIYDASGNKVNASTCFGVQSDLTSAFNLARFVTDQTASAYGTGSVLHGTPALEKLSYTYNVTDEEGNQVYVYKESAEGTYYYDEETATYVEITGDVVAPEGATLYAKTEKTATTTWLEAPDLDEGYYSYTLTCTMGNGVVKTFRSGYFQVYLGTNVDGSNANAHLVTKD